MSFPEERSPYYSTRVRVADLTSPKDLAGMKEFTCEIIFGNQDSRILVKNPNDVLDTEVSGLFEEMEKVFKKRDEWAKERGFTFIDQVDVSKLMALGKGSK